MKVYNLQCERGHGFEGWFSSADDYDNQQARGLITCPMCDSAEVSRLPSAPRLNLSHGQPNQATGEEQTVSAPPKAQGPTPVPDHAMAVSDPKAQMMAAWLQMARHVVENTEDVGTGFAREASKMHHGEVPERPIRGQATPEEKEALREEGVEIAEMVLPAFFNKPLQ